MLLGLFKIVHFAISLLRKHMLVAHLGLCQKKVVNQRASVLVSLITKDECWLEISC
jgi:hypothetical protein